MTPHFVYVSSDAQRTAEEYEALWAELAQRGSLVTLAARDAEDTALPAYVTPKRVPLSRSLNPVRDAATVAILVAALDGRGADVIHATDLRALPSAAAARRVASVPFLFATLSRSPDGVASTLSSRLTQLPQAQRAARRLAKAGVDRFVALHRGIAESWAQAGVPASTIELLESGYGIEVERGHDDGPRSEEQAKARAAAGWERARTIVACVPERWDGIVEERLRETAARLRAHVPAAELFVHAGSDTPAGPWTVAPEEATLLRAADIFLSVDPHVSRPLGVMRASATRVPVIAHDTPGVRALVRDGFNGLVVNAASSEAVVTAVKQLASDAEQREQMGARARSMMRRVCDRDLAAQQQLRSYDATFRAKVGEPLHVSTDGRLVTPSEAEAHADAAARRVHDLTKARG